MLFLPRRLLGIDLLLRIHIGLGIGKANAHGAQLIARDQVRNRIENVGPLGPFRLV